MKCTGGATCCPACQMCAGRHRESEGEVTADKQSSPLWKWVDAMIFLFMLILLFLFLFLSASGSGEKTAPAAIPAMQYLQVTEGSDIAFTTMPEPRRKPATPLAGNSFTSHADAAADKYAIPRDIFRALITQESAWNASAVSHVGASGLTQLMPATAWEHCRLAKADIFDVPQNLDCGADYLATQYRRFGDWQLALAAYNSGPARVAKLGRIPRIKETQNYVERICANSDCE